MTETEAAVDVATIAGILRVSRSTVYRKANSGAIPGFKVGRDWRFFPSVVHAHFAQPSDPWAYSAQSRSAKRRAA